MLTQVEKQSGGRLRMQQIVLAAILLLLMARLVDLQVFRAGDESSPLWVPRSEEMQRPNRGRILEQRGLLLTTDTFLWEVGACPEAFRNDEERLEAAVCLQEALGVPASEFLSLLRKYETEPYVVIRREVPRDVASMINGDLDDERFSVAGSDQAEPQMDQAAGSHSGSQTQCHWPFDNRVWASPYRGRLYPQKEHFSHLVGFTIHDGPSFYGVEEYYGAFLQGKIGPELGRYREGTLPEDFSIFLPSEVGYDLVLSVDWRIQQLIENALSEAVRRTGAEGGTIIVLAPASGSILASASYPAYDPNQHGTYPVGTKIFSDPAISKIYEPGSVFKVVTLAIALDSGAITPDSVFDDPGALEVAGHVFRNADGQAHGQVTATEILARSLNVGIAHVGEETGIETFYGYLPRFGFGSKTGVDLAHEENGLVKYPGNPNWSQSDFIANTFGQGISVTPLQMARAVAAIANGGILMRPHVADRLVVSGKVAELQPTVDSRVISPDTARTLTKMMVTAVELGAPEALITECDVAGKTGTAQVPVEGRYHEEWTIASFVGYAPAHDPAFACLIKLDKPQSSIWGSEVAAPVFREIAPPILRLLQVPPEVEQ